MVLEYVYGLFVNYVGLVVDKCDWFCSVDVVWLKYVFYEVNVVYYLFGVIGIVGYCGVDWGYDMFDVLIFFVVLNDDVIYWLFVVDVWGLLVFFCGFFEDFYV